MDLKSVASKLCFVLLAMSCTCIQPATCQHTTVYVVANEHQACPSAVGLCLTFSDLIGKNRTYFNSNSTTIVLLPGLHRVHEKRNYSTISLTKVRNFTLIGWNAFNNNEKLDSENDTRIICYTPLAFEFKDIKIVTISNVIFDRCSSNISLDSTRKMSFIATIIISFSESVILDCVTLRNGKGIIFH